MRGLLKLVGWLLLLSLAVATVLRLFFVDAAVVGHNAMAPTIVAGDEVLVLRNATLAPGDIALCMHPTDENAHVLGRVLGMRGDELSGIRGTISRNGRVFRPQEKDQVLFDDTVQGEKQRVQRVRFPMETRPYDAFLHPTRTFSMSPVKVSEGLFLLGDNLAHPAQDSRVFGEVDPAQCIGKVLLRLWPAKNSPDVLGHGYFDWLGG